MLNTMLNMCRMTTMLIAAVTILRFLLMRRLPQSTFLVLWIICLVRLLVPCELPSRFSVFTLISAMNAAMTSPGNINVNSVQNAPQAMTATYAPVPAMTGPQLWPLISYIWLAGALMLAGHFILTHVRCRRRYSMSLPAEHNISADWHYLHKTVRRIDIRQSDRILSPMTCGIWHPMIILPSRLACTDDQLKLILTHEYGHIRHFDVLIKWALAAVLCLYWFNPAIWLMYVLANRDMELSCDEYVIRVHGQSSKKLYASAIIGMAEYRSNLMPSFSSFSTGSTQERIYLIMKKNRLSLTSVILALTVIICTTTVFATSEQAPTDIAPGLYASADGNAFVQLKSDGSFLFDRHIAANYTPTGTYYVKNSRLVLHVTDNEEYIFDIEIGGNSIIFRESGNIGAIIQPGVRLIRDTDYGLKAEADTGKLLADYGRFGITFDDNGKMLYSGQKVRYFWDGYYVDEYNESQSTHYEYLNDDGTVDVHTVRSIIDNGDGSIDKFGPLTGIEPYSQKDFDNRDVGQIKNSPAKPTNAVAQTSVSDEAAATESKPAHPDGGTIDAATTVSDTTGLSEKGRTFEEIFSQYEGYGLKYDKLTGSTGNLYYKGQLVKTFIDESKTGVFTFASFDTGEIKVCTVYDDAGRLTGLTIK